MWTRPRARSCRSTVRCASPRSASGAPVLNGHTATVFINFGKNPTKDELIDRLVNYTSKAAELGLPHAPKHFIQYLTEDDRPQVLKDVDYEGGMGVSIGCSVLGFHFRLEVRGIGAQHPAWRRRWRAGKRRNA